MTNSQIRDLQCLDRCILIKSGIIDENESVQPTRLQEQFRNVPNFNISTNFNETCPVLQNITDKCEKAYLIGRCIQYQMQIRRVHQHKQVSSSINFNNLIKLKLISLSSRIFKMRHRRNGGNTEANVFERLTKRIRTKLRRLRLDSVLIAVS